MFWTRYIFPKGPFWERGLIVFGPEGVVAPGAVVSEDVGNRVFSRWANQITEEKLRVQLSPFPHDPCPRPGNTRNLGAPPSRAHRLDMFWVRCNFDEVVVSGVEGPKWNGATAE